MKPTRKPMILTLLVALVAFLALAPNTLAAPTAAGAIISNTASLTYSVGGAPQPVIPSSPALFTVDQKIDLTVTFDGVAVAVIPNSANQILRFLVVNTGNAIQDVHLFYEQANGLDMDLNDDGTPDTILDSFQVSFSGDDGVFVDAIGSTIGTYEAGTDTATFIDELTFDDADSNGDSQPDNQRYVYVLADIPLDNGGSPLTAADYAGLTLFAEMRASTGDATKGAQLVSVAVDTAGMDIVFADGEGEEDPTVNAGNGGNDDIVLDAIYGEVGAFQIQIVALGVTKDSVPAWDPATGTTNPNNIPGAAVEYKITINNTSGSLVNLTTLADALPATLVPVVGLDVDGDAVDDLPFVFRIIAYTDTTQTVVRGSWDYTTA